MEMTAAKPIAERLLVLRAALITPVYLIGTFIVGGVIGDGIFLGMPGHLADESKVAVAVIPALAGVLAGGALWARAMGRLLGYPVSSRLMIVGALGYGPTIILAALALTVLEKLIVEQGMGPALPIHNVFTLLFVPAVTFVAAVGTLALGIALGPRSSISSIALGAGLAAGLTFLVVDLLMDSVGYRVGTPHAAERLTMITHLLTGSIASSMSAGALIGFAFHRGQAKP